jgi:hypothetical protein
MRKKCHMPPPPNTHGGVNFQPKWLAEGSFTAVGKGGRRWDLLYVELAKGRTPLGGRGESSSVMLLVPLHTHCGNACFSQTIWINPCISPRWCSLTNTSIEFCLLPPLPRAEKTFHQHLWRELCPAIFSSGKSYVAPFSYGLFIGCP